MYELHIALPYFDIDNGVDIEARKQKLIEEVKRTGVVSSCYMGSAGADVRVVEVPKIEKLPRPESS